MTFHQGKQSKIRFLITLLFIFIGGWNAFTANINVSAKLDSATLLMGYTTRLRLIVEQPSNSKVSFPLLDENRGRSYIGLLGDSIEISTNVKKDTVKISGNRIRVSYNLNLQSFDSGYYKLPPFELLCDNQKLKTNEVSIRVVPVKVADDAKISGFTNIEPPLPPTEKDNSDSSIWKTLAKYWWIIVLILLFTGVLIWAVIKYKKEGTLLPVKPVTPPYQEAIESLRKLKDHKLWENGREKDYFTGLTYILRRYLAREYGIPAMEMTSRQIMSALKTNEDLKRGKDKIRKLLDLADFVKYAKVRPLPEDNEEAYIDTDYFIKFAHKLYEERIQQTEMQQEAKDASISSKLKLKVGNSKRRIRK